MAVDEGSDRKSDLKPHWMAAHACLKNEFTEDEKCQNLMRWLIFFFKNQRGSISVSSHIFAECLYVSFIPLCFTAVSPFS